MISTLGRLKYIIKLRLKMRNTHTLYIGMFMERSSRESLLRGHKIHLRLFGMGKAQTWTILDNRKPFRKK